MSQTLEKPEFKERELTEEELAIVSSEKEGLFMPIDPNNTNDGWFIHKTNKDKEYEMIKPENALTHFPHFYQILLKSTNPKSENYATSILIDGHSFRKWSDASIYRVKKNAGSGSGGGSWKKTEYKPRFLKGLLVLDPENASAYLDTHQDENWEYKDYKDGNVVLVSYKPL